MYNYGLRALTIFLFMSFASTFEHGHRIIARQSGSCDIGEKQCQNDCVPIASTCCSDGSYCPITDVCTTGDNGLGACCPVLETCYGPGGTIITGGTTTYPSAAASTQSILSLTPSVSIPTSTPAISTAAPTTSISQATTPLPSSTTSASTSVVSASSTSPVTSAAFSSISPLTSTTFSTNSLSAASTTSAASTSTPGAGTFKGAAPGRPFSISQLYPMVLVAVGRVLF